MLFGPEKKRKKDTLFTMLFGPKWKLIFDMTLYVIEIKMIPLINPDRLPIDCLYIHFVSFRKFLDARHHFDEFNHRC